MKNSFLESKEKNSKGITLVALVISIIVLLILSAVSIQILIGNSGLLTRTETVVQINKDSQEEEKIKLAVAAAKLAGEGTLTTENLNDELRKVFEDSSIEVKGVPVGWIYNDYTIYEYGIVKKGKIVVPKEYQQVEYIKSTGTQYIDTGIELTNDLFGAKVAFQATENFSENWILAVWYGNGWRAGQSQKDVFDQSHGFTYSQIEKYDAFTIATSEKNTIKNIPITVQLFGQKDEYNIQRYGCYKLYYCKIYNNKEIIKDLIPCYRVNDNIVGLYDTVQGIFYTNQGNGDDFISGPNV